jgi:hypothetical protein
MSGEGIALGGLEDKLREILSSPEDMRKLADIAASLFGNAAPPSGADGGDGGVPGDGGIGGASAPDGVPAAEEPAGMAIAPEMLGVITRVMGAYASGGGDGDKNALLGAIKPYLNSSRREYMDRAAEIVRFTRVAKAALGEFSGGGHV